MKTNILNSDFVAGFLKTNLCTQITHLYFLLYLARIQYKHANKLTTIHLFPDTEFPAVHTVLQL